MVRLKTKEHEQPKHEAVTVNDIPSYKDLIPGYGGSLSFTTDSVFIIIPKSFIDSWPGIAVDVDIKGEKITLRRAEKKDISR